MFFFGPLSTHLPYIIIGLLYVVSMSVFSFRALAAEPPADIAAEPETREAESNSRIAESIASFEDYSIEGDHFASADLQTKPSTKFCEIRKVFLLTRPPCLSAPFLFPHLSRPPPAMV